jgi:hypothetical protein
MPEIGQNLSHYSIVEKICKGEAHFNSKILPLLTVLSCLVFSAFTFEKSYAEDKKLTLEEVVAKHLASIGRPHILASIKSRAAYGIVSYCCWSTDSMFLPEPG